MEIVTVQTDVLVIGAGLAGICAATAAAGEGCRVILTEKTQVLGGNSGPDAGVHPSGAHRFHTFAAETGIIGQITETAAWRLAKNDSVWHHYNTSPLWDSVLDSALREAGVTVWRNHFAHEPEMDGSRIAAVRVIDTGAYRERQVLVKTAVIDASGDGNISALAGAPFVTGRESRGETGERLAPEQPDSDTLGSSVVAMVRKTNGRVEFIAPPGTPPFHPGYWETAVFKPGENDTLAYFFPSETGGERDTVADEAEIYQKSLAQVYSAWNHIKNISCKEEAKNWELFWIGSRLCKRESRRFLGDYFLTETDVEAGTIFPDAIAYGGFGFDLHDPRPENREYVRVSYYAIPPIYTIPYRSIYSKTVSNLLFASRLISVSHIAHGTTRLQRTLAAIGQAAGIAAALCGKFDCSPREIYRSHIETLRQRLLLNDASIPGAVNNDPLDVAKKASVSATSERRFSAETVSEWLPLSRPAGLMLWDFPKQLDSIAFLLRNQSDTDLTLRARLLLRKAEHPYKGHEPGKFPYERAVNEVEWGYDNSLSVFAEQGSAFAQLSPGEHQVCFDFGQKLIPKDPCCDENRYVIELEAKEKADCVLMAVDNGFYDFARLVVSGESAFDAQPKCPVFTISPEPLYAEAENVISGVNRRFSYNPVAMWQSDPASPFPQSVTLNFETPQSLSAVQVTFDTLERTYTEMPLDCGLRVSGRTVRAYSLEILANETWQMVAEERENYHRLCRHKFPAVKATALRLTVNAAWDNAYGARVYEIRAYEESCNII